MPLFARILVVDDEPLILRLLTRVLARTKAEVIAVATVDAALAALETGVDLVVTDIQIAGRSGVEVARAAAQRRPAPPVIAISAYAEAADGLALGQAGVVAFVAKPFTADDILEVVEGLQAPTNHELDTVVRRCVGDWPMPDVLDAVRRSMVFEALARSHGNKSQAAALLGVSRQNLQKILSRGKV